MDQDTESWLRLSLISGLGARGSLQLLRALGEPAAILTAPKAILEGLVTPSVSATIIAGARIERPELALTDTWLAADPNHFILTLDHPQYPKQLLDLPDPPLLLYAKGNLKLLTSPALSIVGSRFASPQGLLNAEAFAAHLSSGGVCIVSGMATGIDAAAHRGGLSARGSSIAVVGTGLDRVYPARNRALAHELADHGLILSEFALGSPPLAGHFPQRNRIIAALGLGCLVVEAALESGSLITARQAVDIGREIFAIPGSIHSPVSKGCHALLKNGAKLVECADDILAELRLIEDLFKSSARGSKSPPKNSKIDPILASLGWDPVDLDTLCERTGLTSTSLCAILLGFELDGKLAVLPGGRYQRLGGES